MAQKPLLSVSNSMGTITRKGNNLYLILSGNRPADDKNHFERAGMQTAKSRH